MKAIDQEISFVKTDNNLLEISLYGDNGSGIKVIGTTRDEVLAKLSPYIFDILDKLDTNSKDS